MKIVAPTVSIVWGAARGFGDSVCVGTGLSSRRRNVIYLPPDWLEKGVPFIKDARAPAGDSAYFTH